MAKSNAASLKDKTLQVLSAWANRISALSRLGDQYGGSRNIYQALGYPTILTFADYKSRYDRQDIAKAIINRPVHATWHGTVQIKEDDNTERDETKFEKDWKNLYKTLRLKEKFIRLDKLGNLGEYGVLLLGFDDARNPEDLSRLVHGTNLKLLYVKALSQETAVINSYDEDTKSSRYGLPLMYNVTGVTATGATYSLQVHYSRVIHVPGEVLENETLGVPALQAVYNRLMDLEKLVGSSAEMFWRGARPGYSGKADPNFTFSTDAQQKFMEQLDEYENNLRRFLVAQGIELNALETQVSDPSNHVIVQLQMISAITGIPIRILIGSERGELASTEDRTAWLELIQNRRDDFAEIQILRPFIDTCITRGVLTKPSAGYKVKWSDIFAPSKKEAAEIGKTRASALQSYMNNPAAAIIVPPKVFYEYMLGLDEDEVEHVINLHEDFMQNEVQQEIDQMKQQLAVQPAGGGGRQPSPGRVPTVQEETDSEDDL